MFCACVWINLWSLTVVLCNNASFDVNCYLVNNWPHSIEGFPVLCIWQSKTWYAWHRSDPSSHLCPVSQSAVWISHNLEGHIALKQSGKLSQKFPQFLNLLFNTERKRSKGLLLKSFFFFTYAGSPVNLEKLPGCSFLTHCFQKSEWSHCGV